jgi:hypothetical protein
MGVIMDKASKIVEIHISDLDLSRWSPQFASLQKSGKLVLISYLKFEIEFRDKLTTRKITAGLDRFPFEIDFHDVTSLASVA